MSGRCCLVSRMRGGLLDYVRNGHGWGGLMSRLLNSLRCMVRCGMVGCGWVRSGTVWFGKVRRGKVRWGAVRCGGVRYGGARIFL